MRPIYLLSFIAILFSCKVTAQVVQFPQVYYNGQGTGGFPLIIRQSVGGATSDDLPAGSKIGAASSTTTTTGTQALWIQVYLPSNSSTSNSPSYGYMPCSEFYAMIDPSNNYAIVNTTSTPLGVRTCAGCSSSYVTYNGQNAYYGRGSVVALTGTVSSGWYEIYLTTNCSQSTGWVNGTYLTSGSQSYGVVNGRVCDNNGPNCANAGNVNNASISIGSLGSTISSGGFYQYKVPVSSSVTITCTDASYNTVSPPSYSFTAASGVSTNNFYLSNTTTSCTPPSSNVNSLSGPSPVTLTCTTTGGSGGTIAYKWYNGTSCSGPTIGTSSTYDATSTGSYTCKAYITGYESTCYICNTGTATVTSASTCTPSSASVNSPTGTGPLTLTCSATGGSGGNILYKWYAGTSCSGNPIDSGSTYSTSTSGAFSCKAYISGYESSCNTCATGTATISSAGSSGTITSSLGTGYFIQGVSTINNMFTASGVPTGTTKVIFHATGAADVTDNSSSSWTAQFDMGSLPPNAIVYAQYYNGSTLLGYSPNYSLNILAKPSWLDYATISNVSCSGGVIALDANYSFQSIVNNIPYNIEGLSGKNYSLTGDALTFGINFNMSSRTSTISNSKISLGLNILDQAINTFDISVPANLSSGLHLDNNFNLVATLSASTQTPQLSVDMPAIEFPVDPIGAIEVSIDAGLSIYGELKGDLIIGQSGGQWGFIDDSGNKSKITAVVYPSAFIRADLSVIYGAASGEASLEANGRIGGGLDYVTVPSLTTDPLFGGDLDISGTIKIKAFWGLLTLKTYGPQSFYYGMFGDTSAFRSITQSFEQKFGTNSITYQTNGTLNLPDNSPQPVLANKGNDIYAAWIENNQTTGYLKFSKMDTLGNRFSTPKIVITNENSITNPAIATLTDGSALLTWAQNRYTTNTLPNIIGALDVLQAEDIWYGFYDSQHDSIMMVTRIDDDTSSYQSGRLEGQPAASFNSDSTGIIAWVVNNSISAGSDIWYIKLSKSAAGWYSNAPSQLSHLSGANRNINLSCTNSGSILAVWINDPDAIDSNFNSQLVYSVLNGNIWSAESVVANNPSTDYKSLSVSSNNGMCVLGATSTVLHASGKAGSRLDMSVWNNQISQWDASQTIYEEDSNHWFSKPHVSVSNDGFAAVSYQSLYRYPDTLHIDAGKIQLWAKNLNNTGQWINLPYSPYLCDSNAYVWELAYTFGADNKMYTLTQELNDLGVETVPNNGVIFGDPSLSQVLRGLQLDKNMNLVDITEPLGLRGEKPDNYNLLQNYPNPFEHTTDIQFNITSADFVSLDIYDALGLKVANLVSQKLSPGVYTTMFDAGSLQSGVYFYTLTVGGIRSTKSMVLIGH